MKEMFPGSFPSDVLQSCPAYGFFVPAYIFYAFYIFLILLLTFSILSVITKLTKNKREKNKGGTVHQKRNEIPNRI